MQNWEEPEELHNTCGAFFLLATGCGSNSSPKVPVIAFVSTAALDGSNTANANSTANIWLVQVDGSQAVPLTRLTAPGASISNLIWSPDGTRLAFTSARAFDGSDATNPNSTENLWVINADGSHATPVTQLTASGTGVSRPAWSPDGTRLAFESNRALDGSDALNTNSTSNIWLINADASNPTPVTTLTSLNALSFGAAWSPDGKKLAFLSAAALDSSDARNPAINIWTSNADGSGIGPLTTLTASNVGIFTATWSGDSTKIAFTSNRALDGSDAGNLSGGTNVWVFNSDGSGPTPLTQLTQPGQFAFFPMWSPDATKLAYISDRALDGTETYGTVNVWVIHSDASANLPLTRLTANIPDSPIPPAWSPDGSKIAYSSTRGFNADGSGNGSPFIINVWLLNADGSMAVPLTKLTVAAAAAPEWQP